jgi:hypothetical protein
MDAEQLNRLARQFWTVDEIGFHGFSLYLLKNRTPSTSMRRNTMNFPSTGAVSDSVQGESSAWYNSNQEHYHTHRV